MESEGEKKKSTNWKLHEESADRKSSQNGTAKRLPRTAVSTLCLTSRRSHSPKGSAQLCLGVGHTDGETVTDHWTSALSGAQGQEVTVYISLLPPSAALVVKVGAGF